MTNAEMIEKLRAIQSRLFGPVREQSQADRELDEIIAALAAPVAAEPPLVGRTIIHKVPPVDPAEYGEPAAEPPSLVADARQLRADFDDWLTNEECGLDASISLAERSLDVLGRLLAWTPAQAEPAAPPLSEQWRLALYPHVDSGTFHGFLADHSLEGWDDVRREVAALTKIVEGAALPASSPAAPDHGPWKMTVTTWFRCPECGPCGVDEDSCCSTCGSDVEAATGRP